VSCPATGADAAGAGAWTGAGVPVCACRGEATAQATDAYVHDKPWQAIGITAGVGVLVGLAVGMMLNRR